MQTIFVVLLVISAIALWKKVLQQDKNITEIEKKYNQLLKKQESYTKNVEEDTLLTYKKETQGYSDTSSVSHTTDKKTKTDYEINPQKAAIRAALAKTKEPNQTTTEIKTEKSVDKKRSLESFFGRNVIGIAASILIFIGLVFLGTLIYQNITEAMKVIFMYSLSISITVFGIFLTLKKRSNFSLILSGCGSGSLFISIMLTHVHFELIGASIAYSILLVWMIATLFIARKLESTLLSIVAHLGMAISISAAFIVGLNDETLIPILIYQAASIIIIILGNILCCKKTYNFGVFVSLVMTIFSSVVIMDYFSPQYAFDNAFKEPAITTFQTDLPILVFVLIVIAHFICSSFLSYLLSVSTSRLENNKLRLSLHIGNKILWTAALMFNIFPLFNSYKIEFQNHYIYAALTCLGIIAIHIAITLLATLKLNFNEELETFSVLFLSALSGCLLIYLYSNTDTITFLILPALILTGIMALTKNKAYSFGIVGILIVDLFFMLLNGYEYLLLKGTIALPIAYMLIYIAMILVYRLKFSATKSDKPNIIAKLSMLFVTELSLISIFAYSGFEFKTPIALITLVALNILLYVFGFDKGRDTYEAVRKTMLINEIILVAISSFIIARSNLPVDVEFFLYLVIAALTLILAVIRIKDVLKDKDIIVNVIMGLKLTIIPLATVNGLTTWLDDEPYALSIIAMISALACIIIGFLGKSKPIRLYGLVVIMLCVVKLVSFDVIDLNTPLRVVSLIVGGIICFVISAIYNYANKKLSASK